MAPELRNLVLMPDEKESIAFPKVNSLEA